MPAALAAGPVAAAPYGAWGSQPYDLEKSLYDARLTALGNELRRLRLRIGDLKSRRGVEKGEAALRDCRFRGASELLETLPGNSRTESLCKALDNEIALLNDFERAEQAYRSGSFAEAQRIWVRVSNGTVCGKNARAAARNAAIAREKAQREASRRQAEQTRQGLEALGKFLGAVGEATSGRRQGSTHGGSAGGLRLAAPPVPAGRRRTASSKDRN